MNRFPYSARRVCALATLLTGVALGARADEKSTPGPDITLLSPRAVTTMQNRSLQSWLPRFTPPTALAEWQQRRDQVRASTMAALALDPLPERLDLDAKISRPLQREGYSVARVVWQIWPNVRAGGWLYLPAGPAPAEGWPAVLNLVGHLREGARNTEEQRRSMAFAKLGFVSLAIDPVHLYGYTIGLSPQTVMTWSSIRGIDYLIGRGDVDPKRIGATGISGGGLQTMYLMAADDRLAAAAPVLMVSRFARVLSTRKAECRCNHVPGMASVDAIEIAALFAPKPVLFVSNKRDWTKRFEREDLPLLRRVYDLYDAGEQLDHERHNTKHDYDRSKRERVYAFFNQHLLGEKRQARRTEPKVEPFPPAELYALAKEIPAAGSLRRIEAQVRKTLAGRLLVEVPDRTSSGTPSHHPIAQGLLELWREQRAVTLDKELTPHEKKHPPLDGLQLSSVSFDSEGTFRIPAVLLLPPGEGPFPAAVVVHPKGKTAALGDEQVRSLALQGVAVLALDARGSGELKSERDKPAFANNLILGRPQGARAAHDMLRAAQLLRTRPDIDPERIALVGLDSWGPVAVLAQLFDPGHTAIAAESMNLLYRGRRRQPELDRVLQIGDLDVWMPALTPTPLWLGRPVAGLRKTTQQSYADSGAKAALTTGTTRSQLVAWLVQQLKPAPPHPTSQPRAADMPTAPGKPTL